MPIAKAAQWSAELMPLTHSLRPARGIMLREATLPERNCCSARCWRISTRLD